MTQLKTKRYASVIRAILFTALSAGGMSGCAALVGAGAGGAGAIAFTERGAQGDVKGDVREVSQRAEAVFAQMGIQPTESKVKDSGKEQELSGKSGETEVNVVIKATGKDSAHLEVVAREGMVKWNKDYAKEVLSKIISKG